MITRYVEDTSGWEDWLQEYRFGLLLIYPPERLRSTISELRARLLGALESASSFAGARQRSHPFDPHMTIAEFISVERTHELMDELKGVVPEGRFPCEAVSLAVPDEGAHFDERALLELG